MKRSDLIITVILALFVSIFVLNRDLMRAIFMVRAQEEQTAQTIEEEPFTVEVLRSEEQEILSGIALSGRALAARKLDVRAETSGQVISEPLPEGTLVQEGELLCALDAGTRQSNLDQAQANLETAQTQYASSVQLSEKGLASTASLQSAKARLEQAQSAVDAAKRELENSEVHAPFTGTLVSQTAELGSLLQPGSVCASIIALDQINLVGYAAESQIDNIRMGANTMGVLRDGTELIGQITQIATTADSATRTYKVEANVENPGNVRDGASVKMLIALAGTNGHLVPSNALTLSDEGELGVRLNENGVAQFYPAQMIRDTKEGVWLSGLPASAEIIITGQEYAADGQKIAVVYAESENEG